MSLDFIQGKWNDSFHIIYNFKTRVGKTTSESVIDIDYEFVRGRVKTSIGTSIRSQIKYISLDVLYSKGIMEEVSIGLKAILVLHSTSLTWKLRGKLVVSNVVDIHNWISHVTYVILVGGSNETWTWFMERLHDVIGHLSGLVIHSYACKGLENNYNVIFPRIEHRKCMRQLVLTSRRSSKERYLNTTCGQ
jgi:hypothetical protein